MHSVDLTTDVYVSGLIGIYWRPEAASADVDSHLLWGSPAGGAGCLLVAVLHMYIFLVFFALASPHTTGRCPFSPSPNQIPDRG